VVFPFRIGKETLEVNFTYYTLPSRNSFIGMSKKTSEGFEFVVKCFKGMTHDIRDKGTKKIINNREVFDKFVYSLQPLVLEGKLGCVLAQFPYSFFPNGENFGRIRLFPSWRELAWVIASLMSPNCPS